MSEQETTIQAEPLSIDIKSYDSASYGIRLFDARKGHGDINDLETVVEIGNVPEVPSIENQALASALWELVEKHDSELLALYKKELSELLRD